MKKRNEYQLLIESKLYTLMPKTVVAAIAVSYLSRHEESLDAAIINRGVLEEWWVLFDNGIIPQKPPFPRPTNK